MRIMFDTVGYESKPTNFDVALMQDRMTIFDIGVKDIKDKLVNGHTIRPSITKGNKESEWESQQIFMVDIDEGITIDEAIDKYEYLNPSFMYTSFSHTDENNKFRIAFITEDAITDFDIAKSVQEYLINEIEESDKRCKNLNRLYYGGKDIVYSNTDNRLDISKIEVECCRVEYITNNKYIKDILHSTTEYRELSVEDYYKTIRKFDMRALIGKYDSVFSCVLPTHEDNNPSAGIFISEKEHNYGEYVYNCMGCGKTLDNIQLMERMLNKNRYETLKWFENNLKIKKVDNEWTRTQKEKIDVNIEYLLNGDLQREYPEIHKFIKRDIPKLISLYEFSKINCYNQDYITEDGENIFFASINKLKDDVFGYSSVDTTNKTIQMFNLLNLVNKIDPANLPEKVMESAKKHSKFGRITNHFSVVNFSDTHMETVRKTTSTLSKSNFTKKGMSREYILRTFGKDLADSLYPQNKNVTVSKKSEDATFEISNAIISNISEKGYCREVDILDYISENTEYTKGFTKTQLRISADEICKSYNLSYIRPTKENKKKFDIPSHIHHTTRVYVKSLD